MLYKKFQIPSYDLGSIVNCQVFGISKLSIFLILWYLLYILSGTEVVEGGPVSIVNSQQTLLSQFSNRELYGKSLTNLVGFPAPL